MSDVVLLFPKTGMDFGATIAPPHSLLSIAAPLDKLGYHVNIIDQRVDEDWECKLTSALDKGPICVGISVMTGSPIYYSLLASKLVKRHSNGKIPVVWGGPHPSILPEQTLANENIDIVCVGEGDETFLELVQAIEQHRSLANIEGVAYKDGPSIKRSQDRPLIDVETLLPVPWHLIDVERYIHQDFYIKSGSRALDIGQTSRGCPYRCGFCCSACLRKRQWRPMSVEKSLELILNPVKKFNLNAAWIRDDEFYIDRRRAYGICQGIIEKGNGLRWYTSGTRVDVFNKASDDELEVMKRSGADTIKFGAESGSNRILKLINKGITVEETLKANLRAKKHGIKPAYALMIGFPTETFEEINQTIHLRNQLKKENTDAQLETIAVYTALPGTEMWDLSVQYGLKQPTRLEEWINWIFDDFDIKGERNPWLNWQGRVKVGNISIMSILSGAVLNATNSLTNPRLKWALTNLLMPVSKWYDFRLSHKSYSFAPELLLVSYLRRALLARSQYTFK
ncbi:MAG: radical SAM protein [Syntrophales bacterium]